MRDPSILYLNAVRSAQLIHQQGVICTLRHPYRSIASAIVSNKDFPSNPGSSSRLPPFRKVLQQASYNCNSNR